MRDINPHLAILCVCTIKHGQYNKAVVTAAHFFGEDEAHDLVLWMNCNEYPANTLVTVKNRLPAFRRVFGILELARQVENDLAASGAGAGNLGMQVAA